MGWLIGVDEAGYGPNLGPLAIGATAWRVDGNDGDDLYERLEPAVTRDPDGERIAIADSKRLYKPGGGLRLLERGVWPTIGPPGSWPDLLARLDADPGGARSLLPWHAGFSPRLPIDADREELSAAAERLRGVCAAAGVSPPIVRCRLVFPADFNDGVERHGTKGAALSHASIGLLREVIDLAGGGPMTCVLDKHGGRNRYAALLRRHFPEHQIATLDESRPVSRYAWGPGDARVEASFRTGGEAFLPTALASMTAKYLRELAMRAFNAYWLARAPGIKPTAGYPVDAKRFKSEIADRQRELGIDDRILWRNR